MLEPMILSEHLFLLWRFSSKVHGWLCEREKERERESEKGKEGGRKGEREEGREGGREGGKERGKRGKGDIKM